MVPLSGFEPAIKLTTYHLQLTTQNICQKLKLQAGMPNH